MLPGFARAVAGGVTNNQRADADELAFAIDQGRAAPGRMRRRGEDRLVEQIFPGAGEFAFGGDPRGRGAVDAPPPLAISDGYVLRSAPDLPTPIGLILSGTIACSNPKPVS